jgi:hypothetical protein
MRLAHPRGEDRLIIELEIGSIAQANYSEGSVDGRSRAQSKRNNKATKSDIKKVQIV